MSAVVSATPAASASAARRAPRAARAASAAIATMPTIRTTQIRPKCVRAITVGRSVASAAHERPVMVAVRTRSSPTVPSSRTSAATTAHRRARRAGSALGTMSVSTARAPSIAAIASSVTQRTALATSITSPGNGNHPRSGGRRARSRSSRRCNGLTAAGPVVTSSRRCCPVDARIALVDPPLVVVLDADRAEDRLDLAIEPDLDLTGPRSRCSRHGDPSGRGMRGRTPRPASAPSATIARARARRLRRIH